MWAQNFFVSESGVTRLFWVCHKHNRLPLGPIQPSSPSTKELHGYANISLFHRLPDCTFSTLVHLSQVSLTFIVKIDGSRQVQIEIMKWSIKASELEKQK